jgi:glyoxylase-like metal-dependent hydrolase (beta-lactamase superfamily II)
MLKRFKEKSEAEYRQAYADIGLSLDEADDSFNVLLVKAGEETVLVDSGEAGKPYGGLVLESMKLAGVTPQDVTRVVITHSHGDHVLGLLTNDNQPTFPNATYVMSKEEVVYWRERIDDSQRPILAMMEERGLKLIDMDAPIVPGVRAVPIPGHTPGQIAVLFDSEGQQLIQLADMLHSPMQFAHPDWSPVFDADTAVSVPTRRNMLRQVAVENMQALFYHLTFPGLGRVRRASVGFGWRPETH